jgi:hypothetical protein
MSAPRTHGSVIRPAQRSSRAVAPRRVVGSGSISNRYEDRGDRSPGWDRLIPAYGATIRDEGHRERVKWAGRSYTMSRELVLVAGRPCDLPGCAASADP